MTNTDNERRAFEAWAETRNYGELDLKKDKDGYVSDVTDASWEGWLARAEAEGWRPISSVPKDGRLDDLWSKKHGRLVNVSYSPGYKAFYASVFNPGFETWDDIEVTDATHWLPIAPPKEDS